MRFGLRSAIIVALAFAATGASAADRIRLAVQRTGTLSWELDVLKARGLDKKADLQIEALELATPEAGKIAIKGGSADMFLSDWLYVTRERSLGDSLVFFPSSSTVGAVMVPERSPIKDVADLKGRKLAVAGGPLDKNWLLLQGLARRSGLDLRRQSSIVYGAPPLLQQKALGAERCDAHVPGISAPNSKPGHRRHRRRVMRASALGGGRDPRLTFDGAWAAKNRAAVDRFLDAIHQAKEILAATESEWTRLAPRIGVSDPKALAVYRKRYSEGIVRRPLAEEEGDARALYSVLAEVGGTELVGMARELNPGTFYRPAVGP
jgi:NitT/TauT family transport system substrate-binding protein